MSTNPRPGPSNHLDGKIDAGGPYGGPDTFEGDTLTLTVTPSDPSILFFRWDFNNDSVFDHPDQTGAGPLGRWTSVKTVTRRFLDNVFGDLVVEGWDGTSQRIRIETGNNLGEVTDFQWLLGYGGFTVAWKFEAREHMDVLQLGHYHEVYRLFDQAIWDSAGTRLASCAPTHFQRQWNWCTLARPAHLMEGREYLISIRVDSYMAGIDTPPDTEMVEFYGAYYCLNPSDLCFPSISWTEAFIPLIDFHWQSTRFLPDSTLDSASIEVNNVAPTVFGIASDPSPVPEGTPLNLTAKFDDPGLDDTWDARWTFSDGTDSGWQPVAKTTGGARALILHSWTGDITAIQEQVSEACGSFCITVDELDFGPLGENRIPTLDELQAYDVLVVGTNWGRIPNSTAVGDRLAEFMDAAGSVGGGIVMMAFGFYDSDIWGIGGRWEKEKSPLPRSGSRFVKASLGTIYDPEHPFLDGVSEVSAFYRQSIADVTAGASRVADWTDGTVFLAEKADEGGRLACALDFFPALDVDGDYALLIANAIRHCSRQSNLMPEEMPIELDPTSKLYHDDHPITGTHQDAFPVKVEVRDDDHGKLKGLGTTLLYEQTFDDAAECDYAGGVPTWPPGWTAVPTTGWRCQESLGRRGPTILYFYNDPLYGTGDGNSYLFTDTFDLSAFAGVRLEYYNDWRADFPMGDAAGYVQISVDGGLTWLTLREYHHNNPSSDLGDRFVESLDAGGKPSVQFRFYYVSEDDWWWSFDNVRVLGISGELMNGLGSAAGSLEIVNVDALVGGGFDSSGRDTDGRVLFKGFRIDDPALWEPTEWFAYAWDFGDGTPVQWQYKGNMTPPKFDVLLLHSLCLSGDACTEYTQLRDTLLTLDDVASVDGFNFMNHPANPQAPDLTLLLSHDVVVLAMNWGYASYPPWDFVRRQVGNRLAQYLDADGGGVVTLMVAFDRSPLTGDAFTLAGRYVEDDYGAFEKTLYASGSAALGSFVEADHDLLVRVRTAEVQSSDVHSGNYATTIGGRGQAAGRNGTLLARWGDGNSAIGVKELNNGMRTVHIGLSWAIVGEDTPQLLRNAIGWAAGGIPSPVLPRITHQFGNSPPYTVDLMVIDDDMGWAWDPVLGVPVEVLPPAVISHRYITIT